MFSLRVLVLASRRIHTMPRKRRCELVGPPDPISNLRPVIYDEPFVSMHPKQLNHPYSLAEFDATEDSFEELELQYKLQRQQLDAFNHQFWLDANSRFEAAKATILDALPDSATPLDKEHGLSDFYRQWLLQESERTDAYTTEWRKRSFAIIALGFRVEYQRLYKRLSSSLSFRKGHS
ncbi:hypothetical protein APHAL10511_001136 [Amanita phalloides]|nr:hypothetical protein APHAL10511_001136 [Amanita phalloides]